MKQRNSLSAVLAVAIAAVITAGTALAATQTGASTATDANTRATRPKLDVNNDGVIDRNEAAASPRLAAKFDQLDSNKDGKLDRSERPHHGGKGRGHGGGMSGLINSDTDGDGRISKTEASSMPWLARSFDQIDGNRDGYVVRSELRSYHEKMRPQREAERAKQAEERFAAADLNHDGKLSKLEVSEKMPQLSKGFAFMDEDRDGYLTRADLQHSPRH